MAYIGIEGLKVNDKGELIIHTAFGGLKESKPHAYQMIDGKKVNIEAGFRLEKDGLKSATRDPQHTNRQSKAIYGFKVATYDPAHPLVIDPILYYVPLALLDGYGDLSI